MSRIRKNGDQNRSGAGLVGITESGLAFPAGRPPPADGTRAVK